MATVLSIKVSNSEKERLRRMAARRKVSMSALLKQGLTVVLEDEETEVAGSCYEQAAEYLEAPGLIGSSGRGDLSHNKEHLRGFGV